MEAEGCKRFINFLIVQEIPVRCLSTNSHPKVSSNMKKLYPAIEHQSRIWHLPKSIVKKLTAKAKIKTFIQGFNLFPTDCRQWLVSIQKRFLYFPKLSYSRTPVILPFSCVYSLGLVLRVEAIELRSQWCPVHRAIKPRSQGVSRQWLYKWKEMPSTSRVLPKTRYSEQYFQFNEQVKALLLKTNQWYGGAHFIPPAYGFLNRKCRTFFVSIKLEVGGKHGYITYQSQTISATIDY